MAEASTSGSWEDEVPEARCVASATRRAFRDSRGDGPQLIRRDPPPDREGATAGGAARRRTRASVRRAAARTTTRVRARTFDRRPARWSRLQAGRRCCSYLRCDSEEPSPPGCVQRGMPLRSHGEHGRAKRLLILLATAPDATSTSRVRRCATTLRGGTRLSPQGPRSSKRTTARCQPCPAGRPCRLPPLVPSLPTAEG